MTFEDKTERGQTSAVTFELELPHAPAKVWRALTTPELLTEWLLPVVGFELAPGAEFRFEAPPQPGWDGVVSCRMEEVEPERRLRWSWVAGDIDTVVTFTITPTDSGTLLHLVQSGFRADQKQNFGGARYGWNLMSERLIDVLGRLS